MHNAPKLFRDLRRIARKQYLPWTHRLASMGSYLWGSFRPGTTQPWTDPGYLASERAFLAKHQDGDMTKGGDDLAWDGDGLVPTTLDSKAEVQAYSTTYREWERRGPVPWWEGTAIKRASTANAAMAAVPAGSFLRSDGERAAHAREVSEILASATGESAQKDAEPEE